MTSDTSPRPVSPLRARMIEDMIVRGFNEDTRRDYVRHVRASRLFRRLFLAALADAHAAGRLAFFGEIEGLGRCEAFTAHLAPLKRKNWFVYAKPPFSGPEAVLAYLARYTHRVAIANSRLIALDD